MPERLTLTPDQLREWMMEWTSDGISEAMMNHAREISKTNQTIAPAWKTTRPPKAGRYLVVGYYGGEREKVDGERTLQVGYYSVHQSGEESWSVGDWSFDPDKWAEIPREEWML